MSKKIVEAAFLIDGDKCTLHSEIVGKIKVYLNDDKTIAYITDRNNEVCFEIQADCAKNTGFLTIL